MALRVIAVVAAGLIATCDATGNSTTPAPSHMTTTNMPMNGPYPSSHTIPTLEARHGAE
eukprot:m.92662 g.92662  ORF g.92662 m.92662 type:complete len:59 (-) comp12064_c0_seq3:785-961(-)